MKNFKQILFESLSSDKDLAIKFKEWANNNFSNKFDVGRNSKNEILIRKKVGMGKFEKWEIIGKIKNNKIKAVNLDKVNNEIINKWNSKGKKNAII